MKKHKTLYFITRADLNRGQASAQCIHGMNAWAKEHYLQDDHDHVVVYKTKCEDDLRVLFTELGDAAVGFIEPDYNDSLTVVVTDKGPLHLPLL